MSDQNGHPRVLIVDDDAATCRSLAKALNLQGMKAEPLTDPTKVMGRLDGRFYNVVLLDIFMPEVSGLDLLPEILKVAPKTKVIMVTGHGDKETAIEALRRGAFDFLEKPARTQFLLHTIGRALTLQKAELEYEKACLELEARKSELEEANQRLVQTNKALNVMVKNIDLSRHEATKEVVLKVRSIIFPIVQRIKQDQRFSNYHTELTGLMEYVQELVTKQGNGTRIAALLSSSELRIASLIKNGLTSEAIADHLCISHGTVKTHRRNIRKKLGINGEDQSLQDYLRVELGGGGPSAEGRA